ncbi:hypothetical protein Aduo_001248 [Ancylostoma duodenale]
MGGDHQTRSRLFEMLPSHEKYIRTKDSERRETIPREMRRFSADYPQGVTSADIEKCCRTMSMLSNHVSLRLQHYYIYR